MLNSNLLPLTATVPLAAAGVLFLSYVGIPYARLCLTMAAYHFWPFDKFIARNVRSFF